MGRLTLIPAITNWRVVHETDPTQILLHEREILDITPVILKKARLPVQLLLKVSFPTI